MHPRGTPEAKSQLRDCGTSRSLARGSTREDAVEFWRAYSLEVGTTLHWAIGLLDLWVERTSDEWHVASVVGRAGNGPLVQLDEKMHDAPPVAAENVPRPTDVPWRRMLAPPGSGRIEFAPVMPDRPLVVRPEEPLAIPPKGAGTFYVGIPVRVRIRILAEPQTVLAELPTAVMSSTWFGEPTSGELCYSLTTRARRSPGEGRALAHRAVCPVRVTHDSPRDLAFHQLCIHVDALAVYDGRTQLSTGDVEVTFHADDQRPRVTYAPGPSTLAGAGARLSGPRSPQSENVLKRGFTTLRSMTGL
jgi:hypothetical protein